MKVNAINNSNLNTQNFSAKKIRKENSQQEEKSATFMMLNPVKKLIVPKHQRKFREFYENSSSSGKELTDLAQKLAKSYVIRDKKNPSKALLSYEHFYLAYLVLLRDFATEVEHGTQQYGESGYTTVPIFAATNSTPWIWERDNHKKVIKVTDEEIKNVEEELKKQYSPTPRITSFEIDKNLMDDISNVINYDLMDRHVTSMKGMNADDSFTISALYNSRNRAQSLRVQNFLHKLSMSVATIKPEQTSAPLSYYDDVSNNVIKNLDRGNNMFVTYSHEDEKAPEYFMSNLIDKINNLNGNLDLRNIKKDNTDITVFSEAADLNLVSKEIDKLSRKKDKEHIVVINKFSKCWANSVNSSSGTPVISASDITRSIGTKEKNIHIVLLGSQDTYQDAFGALSTSDTIKNYQNIQIPMMDTRTATKQVFETKDYIENLIETHIDDDALELICELPLEQSGSKYANIINFVKKVGSYYINEEKITKEHVQKFWEASQKNDSNTTDSSYDIIFDTKTNLEDIIGSDMTKKQLEQVVYELKNFPKTKGYVIYNQDGFGGGSRKCAKAIAGEVGIPMVVIDAADFAIRDIDTIGIDPMAAIEQKMGKLANLMKTQAVANPNKSVMLFISNFDGFASNPIYGLTSIYQQQAFSKLIKEMKKASSDNNYNMVVIGSSEFPQTIREDIRRPNLFMDDIQIYATRVPQNVKDITKRHIQKNGYEIQDEDKFLKHLSNMILGSSYVDVVSLLDKANILAHKDDRDKIEIEDINRALMEEAFGQTNELEMTPRAKDQVIRHEGGHALNNQFMNRLFKERGDSLRIGNTISNITLDPRGDFLGCVMNQHDEENRTEANLETVFSDIVCSFGGNSTEEEFFNMQGSWGITQDMQSANQLARTAVIYMGLGKNVGHFIPDIDPNSGAPMLTEKDKATYYHDVKVILYNAKVLSDKIVKVYADFLKEFSDENIDKFGTGNCIITGVDFTEEMKRWERNQPKKKREEIEKLKNEALRIVECTRNSKYYKGIEKYNPKYRTH